MPEVFRSANGSAKLTVTVLHTYASSRISVWNTSTLPNRIVFRYYEGFPANVSQGASMADLHDYSVVVQPEQDM